MLAAFSFQPLCALIAFLGAQLCTIQLFGTKHAAKQLVWYAPIIILMAIINPFFSASGSTVLYSFGHTQLYVESLVYGVTSGLVLVSTLSWLECLFAVVSPLEMLQRSSARFPGLQLVLSLSVQLMPQLLSDLTTARQIQSANTAARRCDSAVQSHQQSRVPSQSRLLSARKTIAQSATTINAVCMSALEKSISTFQSIVSRGWGMTVRRSRWNTQVLDAYDTLALLSFALLGVVAATSLYMLVQAWQFYPTMPAFQLSFWYMGLVLFAALPVVFVRLDTVLWEQSV
ncbi:energy-coupling factor transporter transmembrane component T [Lancefieldella parvula]|uniref:energy-coupling factor transporter transmembrane component T n=1 Tax=Lancefieldella parvula TaxID=1382 RepID=UPI0012DFFBB8|nr:energy-coupling factor transporter transmembrane component T [Lancefieldella parvula]